MHVLEHCPGSREWHTLMSEALFNLKKCVGDFLWKMALQVYYPLVGSG
jgi:hypothetical protein